MSYSEDTSLSLNKIEAEIDNFEISSESFLYFIIDWLYDVVISMKLFEMFEGIDDWGDIWDVVVVDIEQL